MVAYIALAWTGAAPSLVDDARGAFGTDADWTIRVDTAGFLLAVRGPVQPWVRRLPCGRGWVIGDLFRRSFGPPLGDEADHLMISSRSTPLAIAEVLRDDAWGRYVAIIDPAEHDAAVFRDPSAAVDALTWRAGPVRLVASHLPEVLPAALWPELTLDWSVIGRWLESQSAAATESGLAAVTSVTPGALAGWRGPERQVWRPADYAIRDAGGPEAAAEALPELLDACVRALTTDAQAILAEISGGLDSAIVASSLAPVAGGKVRQWLNFHAAGGSGDELVFAREVAALQGFALTETLKSPLVFSAERVEAGARGLRPGFNALDSARDRDVAQLTEQLGVDRIVTGQGGDMVFFNTPTPLVAADFLRRAGPRGLVSPYLAQVSRWTRQSVWRTLGQALDPHAAWPGEARVASHGWMQGTAGLPPGKRAHIAVLAQKLTVNIENLRGRRAEVINPLLAQPMVEHCLAIPTPDLTAGGRDRALARRAFVACIPEAVRERREKGDFSVYYGRAVADGLGFLRPYLLAGRLAAKGLIDRARFERLLSEEDLIWRAETAPIMNALTVEAWVRVWEARRGSGI